VLPNTGELTGANPQRQCRGGTDPCCRRRGHYHLGIAAPASGIPLHTAAGLHLDHRNTFQVVAFVVTVGTLLLQGATLPLIIRRLRPAFEPDLARDRAETLRAERLLGDTAGHVLDEVEHDPPPEVDAGMVMEIRRTVARQHPRRWRRRRGS
jgi:hypothetical protein